MCMKYIHELHLFLSIVSTWYRTLSPSLCLSLCLLFSRMYPKIIMYAGILGATTETSVSK